MRTLVASGQDPAKMTLDEIESELIGVKNNIEHIQVQLSRSMMLDRNGQPLPADEYKTWRDKARYALFEKQMRRRELVYWEAQHTLRLQQDLARSFADLDMETEDGMLIAALKLLKMWSKGRDVSSEEWAVIDCLEASIMNEPLSGDSQ